MRQNRNNIPRQNRYNISAPKPQQNLRANSANNFSAPIPQTISPRHLSTEKQRKPQKSPKSAKKTKKAFKGGE
jgi:hypothetical protein